MLQMADLMLVRYGNCHEQYCLMEAVAVIQGEEKSQFPTCIDPALAVVYHKLNDHKDWRFDERLKNHPFKYVGKRVPAEFLAKLAERLVPPWKRSRCCNISMLWIYRRHDVTLENVLETIDEAFDTQGIVGEAHP